MCLVVIAFGQHADYPFVFAGNRDEFHARPTQAAHWWPDLPDVLGGRDLQAGGTWLGLQRNGRFATVTNFRDAQIESGKLLSRGHLVSEFLTSERSSTDYTATIDGEAYAGFNLLVYDGSTLAYLSNRGGGHRVLAPGIYALSNAMLDDPWSKVQRSRAGMEAIIAGGNVNETELLRVLNDRERASAEEVERGRLSFSMAHALTAPFIVSPDYGTRCSTAVIIGHDGAAQFIERRFDASGAKSGENRFRISPGP